MFDVAQTSLLHSRGGGNRGRLQDRDNVSSGNSSERDRDSFSRWRDRQYFGPRRWLESALRDTFDKDSGIKNLQNKIFTSTLFINVHLFILN